MSSSRRKTFIIDRQVQGALLLRVVLYWFFCLISISLVVIGWEIFARPSLRFLDVLALTYYRFAPVLMASGFLLPIVLFDVVRMSGRFVGPVVRLRKGLRDLADGQPVQPMNFRGSDFWREMAGDFNRAIVRISRDASERHSPTEEMLPAEEQAAEQTSA